MRKKIRERGERNVRIPNVSYRSDTTARFIGGRQLNRSADRGTESRNEEGWTLVTSRRRQNWIREERLRIETIEAKFINVYVSNFPEDWTEAPLKEILEKFVGRVADVSIPRKRAKDGKRFAFVRFYRVRNEEALIQRAKGVWIGLHKLLANKARFNQVGESGRNRVQLETESLAQRRQVVKPRG